MSDTDALTPQETQELRCRALVEALEKRDRELEESVQELSEQVDKNQLQVDKNRREVLGIRLKEEVEAEFHAKIWKAVKRFVPWIIAMAAAARSAFGSGR